MHTKSLIYVLLENYHYLETNGFFLYQNLYMIQL